MAPMGSKASKTVGVQDIKAHTSARMVGKSILQCIGNTPLIRLRNIGDIPDGVSIYAKAEWFNPGGSVKDRPALRIIEDGEKSGKLKSGGAIIDSTSGNTGIAYAMIGAAKGYSVTLVMPCNISEERKAIVAAYGADIIYTDPLTGSDGAIIEAQEIVNRDPDKYFFGNQYNNPSNSQAHYDTTGVELWEQTDGEITHFVTGLGTTGTLMGTGRRLKEFNPDVELIAVEPSTSIHGLEGLKHMETAIIPGIYDTKFPDRKIAVDTEDAYKMVNTLGRKEGVLVGYSSGAAVKAALDVAKDLKNGVVVAILPDSGKNYLSTSFWKFY